jgi:hypothetical protein
MEQEPSIAIGPLKIWISHRQFPDHEDYWDGNWVNATALCEGEGSRVKASGAFIHLGELQQWKDDLREFHRLLTGFVELPTMEPTLRVKITARSSATGHLDCEVKITGNHMSERHRFLFEIDQSYLPGLLSQLTDILREFPIRGAK